MIEKESKNIRELLIGNALYNFVSLAFKSFIQLCAKLCLFDLICQLHPTLLYFDNNIGLFIISLREFDCWLPAVTHVLLMGAPNAY